VRQGPDVKLIAGAAAATGFAGLGLLVVIGWPALADLDVALDGGLHRFGAGHPSWVTTMWWLTQLGSFWVVLAVAAIGTAICVRRGRFRAAALCMALALLIPPATQMVKILTARPRPADQFWTASGFAFPSGHTSNATAAAAIVLIACWPLVRNRPQGARIALVAAVATLPLTIGLTRLAGGMHWPSDVLGGWLLTIAVVALLAAASDLVAARSSR